MYTWSPIAFIIQCHAMQLPTRTLEVELTLVSSNHHVEMNPSDVGNNDRYVVQEILKVTHALLAVLGVLCMLTQASCSAMSS